MSIEMQEAFFSALLGLVIFLFIWNFINASRLESLERWQSFVDAKFTAEMLEKWRKQTEE